MQYIYIYLIISLINAMAIVFLGNLRGGWKYMQVLLLILPFVTPPLVAIAIAEININDWTMAQSFWYTCIVALAGYAFNYAVYIVGLWIYSKILARGTRNHFTQS